MIIVTIILPRCQCTITVCDTPITEVPVGDWEYKFGLQLEGYLKLERELGLEPAGDRLCGYDGDEERARIEDVEVAEVAIRSGHFGERRFISAVFLWSFSFATDCTAIAHRRITSIMIESR